MVASLIWAATMLAVATIAAVAGLKAWRGWLSLRRYEIAISCSVPEEAGTGTRIELAGIKERLRKLEAIATGVDL